jgi:hypothetical protein
MFPMIPIYNMRNCGFANSVKSRYSAMRVAALAVQFAYLYHLGRCQLRICDLLAFRLSIFRFLVVVVILIRTFEKMVRVYARWIITFVADENGTPDISMQKKRHSVSTHKSLRIPAEMENSISARTQPAGPLPAFTLGSVAWLLVDFAPKVLNVIVRHQRRVYIDLSGHLKLFLSGLIGVVWAVIHSNDSPYSTLTSIKVNRLGGV